MAPLQLGASSRCRSQAKSSLVPVSEDVKQRLSQVHDQLNAREEKFNPGMQDLEDSFAVAREVLDEFWTKEKEPLAGNADHGKDEDVSEALLKSYDALMSDHEAFVKKIDDRMIMSDLEAASEAEFWMNEHDALMSDLNAFVKKTGALMSEVEAYVKKIFPGLSASHQQLVHSSSKPIINSTNRVRDLSLSPRARTSQRQERSDEASKKRSRSSSTSASEESEDEEEMSKVVRSNGSRIKRRFSGDSESSSH